MNRVYDALKERLPHNWSLARSEGPSALDGSISHYYRWTRWSDGEQMLIEVHEAFAERAGNIDELCDQLSEAVYKAFNDPQAKFTTPLWQQQELTNAQE